MAKVLYQFLALANILFTNCNTVEWEVHHDYVTVAMMW